MADTIRIRAGNKSNMPALGDRELVYCKSENALYIGTAVGGKQRISGISEEEKQEIINEAVAKALEEFAKVTSEG